MLCIDGMSVFSGSKMVEEYQSMMLALRDTLGVVVVDENHGLITDKLKPIMAEFDIDSLEVLADRLHDEQSGHLRTGVLQAITAHDTAWSGYPGLSSLMNEYVLPDMVNQNRMDYRLWTVGCGHGQIAYSLAMLIDEFKQKNGLSTNVEIVATDISEPAVQQAAEGSFDEAMLQGLTKPYLQKYMTSENGQWRVNESLRSMLYFSACDLLEPFDSMGHFDLIICPDVLIYFSAQIKSDILEGFARLLDPSGILIVGSSESVLPFTSHFELVDHEAGVFYRQSPA